MQYQAPGTIKEAVHLLDRSDIRVRILAGGTDLIPQMQARRTDPDLLVDIKKIPETRRILCKDGAYTIGSAVSGAELNEHADLKRDWPGLAEAFDLIGSTQIQGRATLGGNLANASPAADTVPALLAADCHCRIAGPAGEREMSVADILHTPGRTTLRQGEFIVSFHLPAQAARSADAYLRLIPRTEMDIAVVGAGVWLSLDDKGFCINARVALGAVAPSAILVSAAADILKNTELDEKTLDKLAHAVRAACRPINDKRGTIEYRTQVAAVLACRTAVIARARALQRGGAKPT